MVSIKRFRSDGAGTKLEKGENAVSSVSPFPTIFSRAVFLTNMVRSSPFTTSTKGLVQLCAAVHQASHQKITDSCLRMDLTHFPNTPF